MPDLLVFLALTPPMQTLDRPIPSNDRSGSYWQWRGHSVHYVCSRTATGVSAAVDAGVSAGAAPELPSSRPPLLLVHGFGASTDHWHKNIAGLQDRFEVWAIDLLGFGRSAKPDLPDYGSDLWVAQLRDFIREVIGRPAVLAGNSIGGYMVLRTAAEYPELARGVVLLNSAGAFSTGPATAGGVGTGREPNVLQKMLGQGATWMFKQPIAHLLVFLYLRNRWTIRKTLEKVYFDQSAITDELVENIYRPAWDPGAFEVFSNLFKSPPQGEKLDQLLQKLQAPLLLLWGAKDPWIRLADRREQFLKYYPQLTEFSLEAGHCPHDEVPEQVNRLLGDWAIDLP